MLRRRLQFWTIVWCCIFTAHLFLTLRGSLDYKHKDYLATASGMAGLFLLVIGLIYIGTFGVVLLNEDFQEAEGERLGIVSSLIAVQMPIVFLIFLNSWLEASAGFTVSDSYEESVLFAKVGLYSLLLFGVTKCLALGVQKRTR